MASVVQISRFSAVPAAAEKEAASLRGNLRASLGDGIAFGGMVGLGETYLPAFALAAGVGELTSGLVASVPLVAGGIMQMISPLAIRRLGSHKRWVMLCASLQAAIFMPLVAAAWLGSISGLAVMIVASIYWATGLAGGPAWNTWIGTLVPPSVRPRFFALRTRASQAAVFLGFLCGGLALQYASTLTHRHVLTAFATLFAAAGLCRIVSVAMLAKHSEPVPIPANMKHIPLRQILGHLAAGGVGRLLLYLAVVQGAAQMAGPFFTPFMFEKMKLTYGEFVGLISVAFLAKIVALPLWGRLAHRIGARRLLWIGGVGIVPMSAGWVVSQDLVWIGLVQLASGTLWAAYELAFFLLFFESIAEEERTSVLTFYNLINTIAWVAGSLLGGLVLITCGASFQGYLWVFCLSSIGRGLALTLLVRAMPAEVESAEVSIRTMSLRPNGASFDAPVLPSLPDQVPESVSP